MRVLLPLAVFTADNEQIFTVTLDLSVEGCKNASLILANVECRCESIEPRRLPGIRVFFIYSISISAN